MDHQITEAPLYDLIAIKMRFSSLIIQSQFYSVVKVHNIRGGVLGQVLGGGGGGGGVFTWPFFRRLHP